MDSTRIINVLIIVVIFTIIIADDSKANRMYSTFSYKSLDIYGILKNK